MVKKATKPLFTGSDWSVDDLHRMWDVINEIGTEELKLQYANPQFELVTYEQMIDAYTSVGMPTLYNHWSFGKDAVAIREAYSKGQQGLAYEMIINTDPAITYIMENNSAAMQALVMGHAVVGHGSFFKHNYLFKEWTRPKTIMQYMQYAKDYIKECELRHGEQRVSIILDAAHSLQNFGVDKYRKAVKTREKTEGRISEWKKYLDELDESAYRQTSVVRSASKKEKLHVKRTIQNLEKSGRMEFPEENILYFLEKHSPTLADWQREIIRIVRKIAQYFYPQRQTKTMNEGWASFCHHHIMTRLWELDYIDEGAYLEFLSSHCGVCAQPGHDHPYYSGINPYALGYSMFTDLKRICTNPTDEDREYFPTLVDTEWLPTLTDIMENYRDESFVLQFLSPAVARKFKFLVASNDEESMYTTISDVHDADGLSSIRRALSNQYSNHYYIPHIEIYRADLQGSRTLYMRHRTNTNNKLSKTDIEMCMAYIELLWGYNIDLISTTYDGKELDDVSGTRVKLLGIR